MQPPDGLSERGSALWAAMVQDRSFSPSAAVLLAEACRLADRLERLDQLLRGAADAWATVELPRDGDGPVVLVIGSALAEARQQASTLRQIVATLEDMTRKESDGVTDALAGLLADLSSPLRD